MVLSLRLSASLNIPLGIRLVPIVYLGLSVRFILGLDSYCLRRCILLRKLVCLGRTPSSSNVLRVWVAVS